MYFLITLLLSTTAACPILCSGNGQYARGRCQCYSGWKGTECDVPATQCVDPQCGGHGICVTGNCVCNAGHKGSNCHQGTPQQYVVSPFDFPACRRCIQYLYNLNNSSFQLHQANNSFCSYIDTLHALTPSNHLATTAMDWN